MPAESRRPRRRGDDRPHRPAGPLDVRPVQHRQADRGRGGSIPVTGGAVGRQLDQHRALDAGRTGWAGGCRARSYHDAHGRGQEPRYGAGAAYEATGGIDRPAAGGARRRRQDGATLKELADSYDVGKATISRLG